jgi:predicted transcriptional regulator YdeE
MMLGGRKGAGVGAEIVFKPNKERVCCKEIAFIQIARERAASKETGSVDPLPSRQCRMTPEGWHVDRWQGENLAWYGYENTGKPGVNVKPGKCPDPYEPASLTDSPETDVTEVVKELRTYAICKDEKSPQKGYNYGCVYWGFSVGKTFEEVKVLPAADYTKVDLADLGEKRTCQHWEAIYKWNSQARDAAQGELDQYQRHSPNQQVVDEWHAGLYVLPPP